LTNWQGFGYGMSKAEGGKAERKNLKANDSNMRSSKRACVGLVSLTLWLLMYCSCITVKESGEETQNSIPTLVYVKGGTFLMGDVLGDGDRAMLAETPVHEVELGSGIK